MAEHFSTPHTTHYLVLFGPYELANMNIEIALSALLLNIFSLMRILPRPAVY